MSNDSSALYTSNTNQDLLTSPALLLYFHDIFVTAKQFHNMNFKNDALCKTYAAVFKVMVQTYGFHRSNKSNLFTPYPQRYKLLPPQVRGDRWPCSTHVAYFCKVTQINLLASQAITSINRAITGISTQQLFKILKLNVKNTSVCALNYTISVCRKKCHLKNGEFSDSSQFLCLNDKKFRLCQYVKWDQ